ncbi:iron-siderophore ABC transporter substrate-binding protein [Georgenia halophila]|uniref:Iron-siderophore ABC transporter substrate-binding protein n=1 Tax=Georgenia halophila TaxID=620889 RepID=A0ABP8LQQ9_9MICO
MISASRLAGLTLCGFLAVGLVGCSSAVPDEPEQVASGTSDDWTPVTIEHALSTTTIDDRPERVATVAWANHEIPLALGVVPVGMAASTWGDDDGDGVHPWVEERLEELDAQTPVLFDETDGIDFEAVANTRPDVILAGYSGLSQEDYDTLSKIAPVVAYPEAPWATPWRETVEINSKALGMADEGAQLIADIEAGIADAVAEHPELEGATAMMVTHVDVNDLSEISFYSAHDTRSKFFEDLGMEVPASLEELSAGSDSFSGSLSAERADVFEDVDIFVTYGGQDLIDALEADPLLSQLPAVENGAIVTLPGDSPLGTVANPTALQVSSMVDDYVELLAEAARASAGE